MSFASLDLLTHAQGDDEPRGMIADAMRHRAWDLALSLANHWQAQVSPGEVLGLLARYLPIQGHPRVSAHKLFESSAHQAYQAPSYADRWVTALLEAGAPSNTPCSGTVPRINSDSHDSWSGTVWAWAIAADLRNTFIRLCATEPTVSEWERQPVLWNNRPATLLHLAVGLDRWSLAKQLVDGGFSTQRPDAQGALAWENMTPASVADQAIPLNALNLWPLTQASLNEGWQRRGLASGLAKDQDQAWRAAMITHVAAGSHLEVTNAIEDLLRLKVSAMRDIEPPQALYDTWTGLSPEKRSAFHTISAGPMKGKWSLNLAALYTGVRAGGSSQLTSLPPGSFVQSARTEWQTPAGHNLSHFEVWSTTWAAMPESERTHEICGRRVNGWGKVALTGQGMRALAELQYDFSKSLMVNLKTTGGNKDNPAIERLAHEAPVPPQLARDALTTLLVFRATSTGKEKLTEDLDGVAWKILNASAINNPSLRENQWQTAVAQSFTAIERFLLLMHLTNPKDPHNTRIENPLNLLQIVVTQLPLPERLLTPAESKAQHVDFWHALTVDCSEFGKIQDFSRVVNASGRSMFNTLRAWGSIPGDAVIAQIEANLIKNDSVLLPRFQADVRAWRTPGPDSETTTLHRRMRP